PGTARPGWAADPAYDRCLAEYPPGGDDCPRRAAVGRTTLWGPAGHRAVDAARRVRLQGHRHGRAALARPAAQYLLAELAAARRRGDHSRGSGRGGGRGAAARPVADG